MKISKTVVGLVPIRVVDQTYRVLVVNHRPDDAVSKVQFASNHAKSVTVLVDRGQSLAPRKLLVEKRVSGAFSFPPKKLPCFGLVSQQRPKVGPSRCLRGHLNILF